MSTARSTAPAAFIETNVVGTCIAAGGGAAPTGGRCDERAARAFRFLHVSTDEVYGSLGRDGLLHRGHAPTSPNSPYSASKAASDHLARAWHHTYGLPVIVTNCSNNYGPYQFPGEADPADDPQRARGQAAAGLRRRARTCATGSMSRIMRAALCWSLDARAGPARSYNVGGDSERTQPRRGARDLRRASTGSRPGRRAPHERLIPFVTDRPGHDRRYAIDAAKAERELGWAAARELRDGPREDGALVSRATATGGSALAARATAASGSASPRQAAADAADADPRHRRATASSAASCWPRPPARRHRRSPASAGRRSTSPTPTPVGGAVAAGEPDLVVNAAAYTAVDQAESEPERAFAVNARRPGARSPRAAPALGVPLIHVSTDYVFDGTKRGALCRGRPGRAARRLWRQQGGRRARRSARALPAPSSSCAPPGSTAPHGQQLRPDHAAPRRASGDELRVVADQHRLARPAPATSPTRSSRSAERLLDRPADRLRHLPLAGAGQTTWCGFAEAIVARCAGATGRPRRSIADRHRRLSRRPRAGRPTRGSTAPRFAPRVRHHAAALARQRWPDAVPRSRSAWRQGRA